jgi:glutamate/tyrosine decarboxylase-like PLP-dependent enzyme
MVSLGREGYRRYAKQIFETAFAMQDAVRAIPELRIMGDPTFCFAFTSDEFSIYHVVDLMRERGWRFNGLQYPDAVHMCVTRPQTQPGVVETFAKDLADGVAYAKNPPTEQPASAAVYGGLPEGVPKLQELVRGVMIGMMDTMQDIPSE